MKYSGDVSAIAQNVRAAVQQVDPKLPIFELRTQHEQSEMSVGEERMFANLSSAMGMITLMLAAIGLYGIMSYSVRRRTTEIGVRMALGAQQGTVLKMIVRESMLLLVIGLIIGVPIAIAGAKAASSVLEDVLYGVRSTDPLSFGLAIGTMTVVALLAGYLPARRASRTDPMVALRYE